MVSEVTTDVRSDAVTTEKVQDEAKRIAERDGVLRSLLRGLFWPFGLVARGYRWCWWVLGHRQPKESVVVDPQMSTPGRQSLTGRKRLHKVTRLLLAVLPRWLQSALGYPVSSSIGRCLSPEVRESPTKPSGKGSKRKQGELDDEDDDDDDEEEEEEYQTWVQNVCQDKEYTEEAEDQGEDPDYEPSTIETASEEYCSHNDTEEFAVDKGVVVIEDVNAEVITAESPAV